MWKLFHVGSDDMTVLLVFAHTIPCPVSVVHLGLLHMTAFVMRLVALRHDVSGRNPCPGRGNDAPAFFFLKCVEVLNSL